MFVLIRAVAGENLAVHNVVGLNKDFAVSNADDIIRAYLAEHEMADDITYEAGDHPMGPGPMEGLVGVWVCNDMYWELWEVNG